MPELQPTLRSKVEIQLKGRILGDLHAATKFVNRTFFGQADKNRLRRGLGRPLVLHKSTGDLLKNRVILGRISTQQLTELLRPKVELILLQDRIVGRCLSELFVVCQRGIVSIVIKIQPLATSIETNNRLLFLKVRGSLRRPQVKLRPDRQLQQEAILFFLKYSFGGRFRLGNSR